VEFRNGVTNPKVSVLKLPQVGDVLSECILHGRRGKGKQGRAGATTPSKFVSPSKIMRNPLRKV